jgi:hypothetical protein
MLQIILTRQERVDVLEKNLQPLTYLYVTEGGLKRSLRHKLSPGLFLS